MHMIVKFFKYLGGLGAGLGCGVYLHYNEWDVTSVGLVRVARTGYVAALITLDYKWSLYGLRSGDTFCQAIKNEIHQRSANRLLDMCNTNKGIYIKVGQHVGSMAYLLPVEFVKTLAVLHDDAPRTSMPHLKKVVEEDLGIPIDELFVDFDDEPLGTASLAQVHKAQLKNGDLVAVKIQHPFIRSRSYIDMKTMEFVTKVISRLFPEFQLLWLAEELKLNLPRELSFTLEGRNCEKVGRIFKRFPFLRVPKIYWDYTSDRVLTMEFCDGGKITDKTYMIKHDISCEQVCTDLGRLYSEMIFVKGYVHCDPHPGNIFVRKNNGKTELVLLDHGLYQWLSDDFRFNYSQFWLSIMKQDVDGIQKYSGLLGCGHAYGLLACVVATRSWDSITKGVDKVKYTEAEEIEIQEFAGQNVANIADILNRVPRQMLLLLKCNDLIKGIQAVLNVRPDSNSFLTMTRCCLTAVHNERLRNAGSNFELVKLWVRKQWDLFRIDFYSIVLRLKHVLFRVPVVLS